MKTTTIRGCERAVATIRTALIAGNFDTARRAARHIAATLPAFDADVPVDGDALMWALVVVTAENVIAAAWGAKRVRIALAASYA